MLLKYKWNKREDGRYIVCFQEGVLQPIVIVDNEITAVIVNFELNKAYEDGYNDGCFAVQENY